MKSSVAVLFAVWCVTIVAESNGASNNASHSIENDAGNLIWPTQFSN